MNRLVIIGNGFDLAHGLKTKYSDFIDDFWGNVKNCYKEDNIKSIVYINEIYSNFLSFGKISNYSDFKNNIEYYAKVYKYDFIESIGVCRKSKSDNTRIFEFRNEFFRIITLKRVENWVDIESEYYYQLKKITKSVKLESRKSDEDWLKEKNQKIKILNDEFEQIKLLFEKYLKEKVEPEIGNIIDQEILYNLKISGWKDEEQLQKYLQEFPKDRETQKHLIEENNNKWEFSESEIILEIKKGNKIKRQTVFLNFNYTSVIEKYLKEHSLNTFQQIQIHGKIDDKNNKMNFGFGDEMDDDYKMIENINDNEYLRNFKSFGYSQNSNYKDLLDFIDSEKFQVYIMGHSCGISDRTMLNTIFEHNNCRSIKIFYYEWKDQNGQVHDNYTELVQNISRHFNKKKLMREKVVNKSLCQPLPQSKNDL